MTEIQRKGIEILNGIQDGSHALTDDDYFFLLSFIIDRPEVQYVPQIVPVTYPYTPLQPYYGRWEITCKTE